MVSHSAVPKPPLNAILVQFAPIDWVELESLPADAEAASTPRSTVAAMMVNSDSERLMCTSPMIVA